MRNHFKGLSALRSRLREHRRQGLLDEAQHRAIDAALAEVEHAVKVGDRRKIEKAINAIATAVLKWQQD
jgi:hypothetical protein